MAARKPARNGVARRLRSRRTADLGTRSGRSQGSVGAGPGTDEGPRPPAKSSSGCPPMSMDRISCTAAARRTISTYPLLGGHRPPFVSTRPSRRRPPMPLGSFDRSDNLARLGVGTFDVLVVGGGITGAGVALDAAVPRPAHRPRRARRLRLRHVVEVVQARPRRAALPPERRRPPRLRGAARAPAPAAQRPAPGEGPAVPHPGVHRQGRHHPQAGGPRARLGHVDVRPDRRPAHRQGPPPAQGRGGPGPHADARRPPGLGLPLLRRPDRRRPPDAHAGADGSARLRRHRRQPRRVCAAWSRPATG